MKPSRPLSLTAAISIIVTLLWLPASHALQVRQDKSRFDAIAIPDPSIVVSPAPEKSESTRIPGPLSVGWRAFKTVNGEAWDIYLDARSAAPLLVQGQGIPFIPGSGNTLRSAAPVTLHSLEVSLREFMARNAALLSASDAELVVSPEGSGQITQDLWQVAFDRVVAGVPVTGDRYIFYIGHGNLIAFGATRWSPITTSHVPSILSAGARAILFRYMGLKDSDVVQIVDQGTLTFVPKAAAGTEVDSFEGATGTGYETALAWRISLSVEGEPGQWQALVDAHTGAVLALYDTNQYAQVKGGVFPVTDDAICPDGCEVANFPMPFANLTIGANTSTAGSMGFFACTPGGSTATTTLNAQYIRVVDTCGTISVSTTCDSDLDLKTSAGTDCTVPAGTSAGDTHASRSSFYHLNRIKEHARAWLPANTWLTQQLRDNVNLNSTCNAFWNDGGASGTVNFYRSGGGCRNTGEIASVFLHEWGHGLDQNDGGNYDNPSEAYADITSFLLTHRSCIGRGFTSSNCGGYGNACLACTGVRDQDWNQHSTHAPQTPENWPASCPGGSGPCGREVHCESYLSGETLWDLAVRDLPAAGLDQQTAWQTVDRLWYRSRTGSGGNAYSCGSPASNRSCAATTWMQKLRVIDDDDGNLANGTPHAAAIFAAFSRHNIPCGAAGDAVNQSTSSCPALAAPILTTTPGSNQIGLSWTAVAGASTYNVLRNDQGCSWGYNIIATVAGTTYTDTNLPNSFPLYYSIQAVGSNTACTGTLGTCTSAQAGGTADLSVTKTDSPDPVATGGTITYTVTVSNGGPNAASSAQLSDSTPVNTTFLSISAPGGWSCSNPSVGGTGAISCTNPTLASGANAAFTVAVKVNTCIGNGTVISNTATVSSASDPNGANNSATATTTVTDSGACNDGNACTQTDTCQGGTCVGSNPVICSASDQCHDVGVCNPANGMCNNPAKANGSACNDGNACTQTDTCQAGVCTGGNPVICTASDQCHNAGVCNPANGVCSNPVKQDGSVCSDGNGCTQTDTCQAGVCTGANPVTCTALDQCHDAGVCNQANGQCSNPAKPNGSVCNDSNACTQTDTCQAGACTGGNPVTCTASDQCHNAGICNPANGQCSDPAKPNGSACSDGNGCTQTDTCQSGVCTGANPVTCTASDQCHDAGVCNPANGVCSNPAKQDGSACSDGNGCTQTDTCQSGACTGANPVTCTASDQCHDAGICNPANGQCSNPAKQDGSACSDGNACTQTDTCQAGTCTGANPMTCTASDQCHDVGVCKPTNGQCTDPEKPDGSACSDGSACTQTDTCQSGVCTGANPVTCTASDQCHDAGTCNPADGLCSNPAKPDGSACSDGNACTQTDTCQSGSCAGANPVACTASDQCHEAGDCNPANGKCSNPAKPDGAACDDGNPCTTNDACTTGACGGQAVPQPTEVNDSVLVTKSGPMATIAWTDGPGPFNVYRGLRSGAGTWSYNHTCLESNTSGPSTDASVPGADDSWYYLVTRRGACGESIPGRDSDGMPEPNANPCP